MNDNLVSFKGKKDCIEVVLDSNADFDTLKEALAQKAQKSCDFFNGASSPIRLVGRELSVEAEVELIDIITKNAGIKNEAPEKEDSAEENKGGNLDELISKALNNVKKNQVTFHKGSVRSGQAINFAGSIVVIGDVNPGGEIIAEGNVIILGNAKGLIQAGSKGARDCFAAALVMQPTQLRIGDIIACFPEDPERKQVPVYAYIKDDNIIVEPLL